MHCKYDESVNTSDINGVVGVVCLHIHNDQVWIFFLSSVSSSIICVSENTLVHNFIYLIHLFDNMAPILTMQILGFITDSIFD